MPQNSNLLFHNRFTTRSQVSQLNLSQNGKENDSYQYCCHQTHRLEQVYHHWPSGLQMWWDQQKSQRKNLRMRLLIWERTPSSMPGYWANWKLNMGLVSPLIFPCRNSRPASSIIDVSGHRDYPKHAYRHTLGWLCCADCCCCWHWWSWSRDLQEWADLWACTSGLQTVGETTNCWC